MKPRLAILCDFAEENWPSMDLVAEMLQRELAANHSRELEVASLQPALRWRFARLPIVGRSNSLRMVDRAVNRMRDYPNWLTKRAREFDLFHLADHSYSQLVHVLPAGRTGVFCHDLDTFRCLLEPQKERRPKWFRMMARKILSGMQKARVVFHSTKTVGDQILRHGLVDAAKLVQAPLGIAPEFTPEHGATEDFMLHVGSCIPRKRMDVLLDVFASLATRFPELRLIQVGGQWTPAQIGQIERLKIGQRVVQLPPQSREALAELYRRSRVVLMPSESEGFGLPVAEALACGAVVIASDISVLREVGGDAVMYCGLGDAQAWVERISGLFSGTEVPPPLQTRLARAARYSWAAHARVIADTYLRIVSSGA